MEEGNIAVCLCIMIIASAILRIRRDRTRPGVWARSWIRRRARYVRFKIFRRTLIPKDIFFLIESHIRKVSGTENSISAFFFFFC